MAGFCVLIIGLRPIATLVQVLHVLRVLGRVSSHVKGATTLVEPLIESKHVDDLNRLMSERNYVSRPPRGGAVWGEL